MFRSVMQWKPFSFTGILLLLSFLNPQDMAGIQIDDVRCELVVIMKLEFINSQMDRLMLWLLECLSVFGIEPLQPRLIDILHDTLV